MNKAQTQTFTKERKPSIKIEKIEKKGTKIEDVKKEKGNCVIF